MTADLPYKKCGEKEREMKKARAPRSTHVKEEDPRRNI